MINDSRFAQEPMWEAIRVMLHTPATRKRTARRINSRTRWIYQVAPFPKIFFSSASSKLTVYSVGYREVRPVDTAFLYMVTVTLIVLGCTGMIISGPPLLPVSYATSPLSAKDARGRMPTILHTPSAICSTAWPWL